MMRVALYTRVSTHDQQTLPLQQEALLKYAHRRGWDVVREVSEIASGATGVKRPKRDELLLAAKRREVDAILVWRLDRWGRSVADLVNFSCRTRSGRCRLRFRDRSAGPDDACRSCDGGDGGGLRAVRTRDPQGAGEGRHCPGKGKGKADGTAQNGGQADRAGAGAARQRHESGRHCPAARDWQDIRSATARCRAAGSGSALT
jgi:hypothetical protein